MSNLAAIQCGLGAAMISSLWTDTYEFHRPQFKEHATKFEIDIRYHYWLAANLVHEAV